jgi:hypothetical protein
LNAAQPRGAVILAEACRTTQRASPWVTRSATKPKAQSANNAAGKAQPATGRRVEPNSARDGSVMATSGGAPPAHRPAAGASSERRTGVAGA